MKQDIRERFERLERRLADYHLELCVSERIKWRGEVARQFATPPILTKREFVRQFERDTKPGTFVISKWRKPRWRVVVTVVKIDKVRK